MKVQIKEKSHTVRIALPTKLVFNRLVLRMALEYCGSKGASAKAADALAAEIKRIKDKHGSWVLAEVYNADGVSVSITL